VAFRLILLSILVRFVLAAIVFCRSLEYLNTSACGAAICDLGFDASTGCCATSCSAPDRDSGLAISRLFGSPRGDN